MEFKYCCDCGEKLSLKNIGDEGAVPYCNFCGKPFFPMFSTCVIGIVKNEIGEVALIKQSYGDLDRYKCVAGFIKPNESAEEAILREISEEIGITATNPRTVKTYFYGKRDQLMIGLLCDAKKSDFTLSGEVNVAEWFCVEQAKIMLNESVIARKLLEDALL